MTRDADATPNSPARYPTRLIPGSTPWKGWPRKAAGVDATYPASASDQRWSPHPDSPNGSGNTSWRSGRAFQRSYRYRETSDRDTGSLHQSRKSTPPLEPNACGG